ncbi:pentapeptide repeat-containing protein [Planktotalea lamellibrachiae]|nr:pentapeptide repeat-containing protein [Aliiroseovarius lamellibrachiae]
MQGTQAFWQTLTSHPMTPWLGWLVLGTLGVFWMVGQIRPHLQEGPIEKLQKTLGAEAWPGTIFVSFFLLYAGLTALTLVEFVQAFSNDETQEDIRNVGIVLAAFVGFPFVVWRAVVAHRQADTAQQDMITDRINKAVENLGTTRLVREKTLKIHTERQPPAQNNPFKIKPDSAFSMFGNETPNDTHNEVERVEPNLEVRLGGILALERIAQEEPSFHIQIMEILTAYVRENSRVRSSTQMRTDIQLTIEVIGRRSQQQIDIERHNSRSNLGPDGSGFSLDLSSCDLSGVRVVELNLEHANFHGTDFRNSLFSRCQLQHSRFANSSFKGVLFIQCSLASVHLSEISLSDASFNNCDLSRAFVTDCATNTETVFSECSVEGTAFRKVDLSEIQDFATNFGLSFLDGSSASPAGYDIDRPDHWSSEELSYLSFKAEWEKFLASPPP